MVVVNTRTLAARPTGVQRYTLALLNQLGSRVRRLGPAKPRQGAIGHLWEQFVLPAKVGGELLWSPGTTGPLRVGKQVVTIHDLAPLDHPQWVKGRFGAWYRWLVPKLIRKVRHVIAVSEFTKERILAATGVGPKKITVVPNGVDERFAPKGHEEVQHLRRSLGIPSGRYILSLGTLAPRKNLPRLLQAWNAVQATLDEDIWLVVAGSTGERIIFPDMPLGSLPPRVRLTGYVSDDDLPSLYSGAIALVYPSLYEGFGLPVLEAMACGVPVITSNQSALADVAGQACILVDPHDCAAIADAIGRMVTDPVLRRELAQAGRPQAQPFTWQRTAEMTWQVLQEADDHS